jgi:hypothetical protein
VERSENPTLVYLTGRHAVPRAESLRATILDSMSTNLRQRRLIFVHVIETAQATAASVEAVILYL